MKTGVILVIPYSRCGMDGAPEREEKKTTPCDDAICRQNDGLGGKTLANFHTLHHVTLTSTHAIPV